MLFKDIIGQQEIKSKFISSVKEKRISHAQLILGPEGSGKLALAIALAQYISCEDKKEDDSCGVCKSCVKYQKLVHPDLHFVFPVVKKGSKEAISENFINEWREFVQKDSYFSLNQWLEFIDAENSQGLISVAESGEIIKKLTFKTYESEYKIMIIWLPEKMHNAAANKLLKILEEPYPNTVFLLVSENSGQIIQTILSRTQLVKVPKIDDTSLGIYIKEKYNLPETEVNNVVKLSNGNYNAAINIMNTSDEQETNLQNFISVMRLCYGKNILEIIKWAEEMSKSDVGRERQKGFLQNSLRLIRENFMLNKGNIQQTYLTQAEMDFSSKFNLFINESNVSEINRIFSSAYYHVERNGNTKIIMLDMALRLMLVIRK